MPLTKCTMCSKPTKEYCRDCKSAWYCSSLFQERDKRLYDLLCSKVAVLWGVQEGGVKSWEAGMERWGLAWEGQYGWSGTWDKELCLAREGNCMRWMESGGLLEVEGDVVIWWVEPCLFRRFRGLIEAVPASTKGDGKGWVFPQVKAYLDPMLDCLAAFNLSHDQNSYSYTHTHGEIYAKHVKMYDEITPPPLPDAQLATVLHTTWHIHRKEAA